MGRSKWQGIDQKEGRHNVKRHPLISPSDSEIQVFSLILLKFYPNIQIVNAFLHLALSSFAYFSKTNPPLLKDCGRINKMKCPCTFFIRDLSVQNSKAPENIHVHIFCLFV